MSFEGGSQTNHCVGKLYVTHGRHLTSHRPERIFNLLGAQRDQRHAAPQRGRVEAEAVNCCASLLHKSEL